MPDAEPVNRRRGMCAFHNDFLNTSPRRTLTDAPQQVVYERRRTLRKRLKASIGEILHVAGYAE